VISLISSGCTTNQRLGINVYPNFLYKQDFSNGHEIADGLDSHNQQQRQTATFIMQNLEPNKIEIIALALTIFSSVLLFP
jgi:hypothetical protein